MNRNLSLICFVSILFLVNITGCITTTDQTNISRTLLGTWQDKDTEWMTFEFFSNGSCLINTQLRGTYAVNNSTLVITYPGGEMNTYDFYINSDGNIMSMTNIADGYIRIFSKQ